MDNIESTTYNPLPAQFQSAPTSAAPQDKPQSSLLKKIIKFIFITILFVIISGIIIWWFFPQVYIVPMAKGLIIKQNSLEAVNRKPATYSISTTSSHVTDFSLLSYSNVSLKVPWKNIIKENESDSFKSIIYEGNNLVSLTDINIAAAFKNSDPQNIKKIKDMFGEQALSSDYNFVKILFSTTEKELSIFSSTKSAVAKSILLILKSTLVSAGDKVYLYNFDSDKIKGFIIERVNKSNHFYDIYVFDQSGSQKLTITVGGPTVTKEEADFILSSIELN